MRATCPESMTTTASPGVARADSAPLRDARADAVAVAESVRVADAQLLALALGDVDAEPDADGDERDDVDSRAEAESEFVDIVERDARVDGEPLREPRALGDEDDGGRDDEPEDGRHNDFEERHYNFPLWLGFPPHSPTLRAP
jgi:hypothetical protein